MRELIDQSIESLTHSSEKPYFDRNFVCCTKKFNDKMVFLYLKHEAWNKNLNSKLGTKI